MENRIQELRKSRGISQADLADMMCVTRQTIISLEKGRYNASLELAYKLATFFNLTIEDVFLFEEKRRMR
ncbi:helix-turn-helix transcriptional regulator [Streptococcus equi subsp. zooepidemicus]|nr:helix-turn-helix transcriptional regulator [Streptococcus equi subsp. zooepidemicus]